MQIDGAVIKEQNVTFAIVVVKPSVLTSSTKEQSRLQYQRIFPGMPVILMAQNSKGVPTYDGRKDIVKFLANTPFQAIPWKRYTL